MHNSSFHFFFALFAIMTFLFMYLLPHLSIHLLKDELPPHLKKNICHLVPVEHKNCYLPVPAPYDFETLRKNYKNDAKDVH